MALPTHRITASLLLTLVVACKPEAPPAPSETLVPSTDSLLLVSGDATRGLWLGAGHWAVYSAREGLVDLVDFTRHTSTPLGARQKAELKAAAGLFRQSDTLFVRDWALRRVSAWTFDGAFVRAESPEGRARGVLASARDAAGQFYFELPPEAGPDGSGNRDSAVVIRRRSTGALDTVAKLSPLDLAQVNGEGGTRFERRIYSGDDAWGVLPDGSLWLARVYQNRVDWRSATGEVTKGEALRDRVLEVVEYDRQLFIRNFPPEMRSRAEQLPFAPIKAPFEAAFGDDASQVWLEKSRSPADSGRMYQVVGRDGRLARQFDLRGQARILAVGGGVALTAERIATGYRLTQVPLPARPASTH